MDSMASRSKLCGHLVLVTGFWNGRSVRGHLREMISLEIARSEVVDVVEGEREWGRGWD